MFWFIVLQSTNPDTLDTLKRKDIFIKSPTKAALRSAVIPGWGQFYNGKKFKGFLLGGLTLLSFGYTARKYYDMYSNPSNTTTSSFLGALILNIAVWGYTIADAFVDAYLYGFKAERDTVFKDLKTVQP